MRWGVCKLSLKKSMAARPSIKRSVRHNLGLKAPRGRGWLTDSTRTVYHWAYSMSTLDLADRQAHGQSIVSILVVFTKWGRPPPERLLVPAWHGAIAQASLRAKGFRQFTCGNSWRGLPPIAVLCSQ